MLNFLNRALQGPSNHQNSKLSTEEKEARLKVVKSTLSNMGMAGIKKYSDKIEDHSDKDIDALIEEKTQLESDLGITIN